MAFSDDDEDLRRAIALSLQETLPDKAVSKVEDSVKEFIILDSDDEVATTDDDATTDGESSPKASGSQHAMVQGRRDNSLPTATSDSTYSLGLLGLDRRKMEKERLARKRKASISPPPMRKSYKTSLDSHRNIHQPELTEESDMAFTASTIHWSALNENINQQLRFPYGIVKKTWAFGHVRVGDDVKLEEVLQKNDLNLAVLSSFQWDIGWLLAKIDMRNTKVTLVMQAKEDATKAQYRQETASMQNLRLCFPSMEGQVNCMHSKLTLLSHPSHLRIAVPTANLVPYDWGEAGGTMENTVFLIDLPRLPKASDPAGMTSFGKELIYFCEAMRLEQNTINSLYNFDFGATKDLAFVHTIGGAHIGEAWRRTGYCGLGRAVQELNLASKQVLKLDFVTSSIGSLSIDFLAMLYLAAQGDDGMTEYERRNPPNGKSKAAKLELQGKATSRKALEEDVRKNFHIYFPTKETVKASKAGYAGTICLQSKWYDSAAFPRFALRDCRSTRQGLLMHSKIIYVRSADKTSPSKSWAYIGSANCSESAWGKLLKDRSSKLPKLNCRNWECGVIVPIRQENGNEAQERLHTFDGVVPVPMQYPGDTYGDRKPWYFSENS